MGKKRTILKFFAISSHLDICLFLPGLSFLPVITQPEYFGQYGEITKLVINHHQGVSPEDPRYGSASAYITFRRQEDAWAAICSVDGFRLMGRTIRASFGTTKYCNSFLRNLPCNNPECLYLHELGDEGDRFTKDEVQLGLARHGSSFAFKEEVLGSSERGNGSRGGGPGDNGRPLPPVNPVLPPPCPVTPTRPATTTSTSSSNSGSRMPSNDGSSASSAGTSLCGNSGSSYGRLPTVQSPTRCQTWSGEHQVVTPGSGGVGTVGSVSVAGGIAGMRGALVGSTSPAPIGSDGRPRPRRRRGQRGRRGSGGSGSNGSLSLGGITNAGGVGVARGGGAGGLDGGVEADVFTDGECVYGPGELCLVTPAADWGQQPVGVHGGAVGTSSSALSHSLHSDSGAYGATPRLTSTSLELSGRSSSSAGFFGDLDNIGMSGTAMGLGSRTVECGKDMVSSACSRYSGGLPVSIGGNGVSSVMSGTDICHPSPTVATWGGNDRSTSSNRSGGGNGGLGGYWGGKTFGSNGARGSPLATSETLTNTPPVELSPSESMSPPSAFPSLGGLGSRGLWNLGGLGTGNSNGGDDRDHEGGGERRSAGGMYSHPILQVRPPPAFFDFRDGVQTATRRQLGTSMPGSARKGSDVLSMSASRLMQQRQDRSRSLDLSSLSLEDDGETRRTEQQSRWNSTDGTVTPHPIKQYLDESRAIGKANTDGVGEVQSHAAGAEGKTALFLRHSRSAAHLTRTNSRGALTDEAFVLSKDALCRSPSVPPGLSLPSCGSSICSEGGRDGRRYSDDGNMYSVSRLGPSERAHRSTSCDAISGEVGNSGDISNGLKENGSVGDSFTQGGLELIRHHPPPFIGFDQFSAAVSQDEVSD